MWSGTKTPSRPSSSARTASASASATVSCQIGSTTPYFMASSSQCSASRWALREYHVATADSLDALNVLEGAYQADMQKEVLLGVGALVETGIELRPPSLLGPHGL